jgi:hypothetical protein
MPSNYTGDSTATQAPSPAPSNDVGAPPIVALPIDADAFNSAAFYQGLKAAFDWLNYFQKAIGAPSMAYEPPTDWQVSVASAATFAMQFAPTGLLRTAGTADTHSTLYIPIRGLYVGQLISHVDIRCTQVASGGGGPQQIQAQIFKNTDLTSAGGVIVESNFGSNLTLAAGAGEKTGTIDVNAGSGTRVTAGDLFYLIWKPANGGDVLYGFRIR